MSLVQVGGGAATYNSDTTRPGTWRRFFQERQHDEHLRLHLPRLRRTPGSPTPRLQPGHVLHTLLLGAHHLPADFLNDATSYRVTVISGDVDNNAHVQAVASLTGLALPQARALLRAPAGWRSRKRHTRSRRCRRRLPGPDWSSGSSRHFRGDPRRPMRAIPREGVAALRPGRRHLIKRSLIRSSKVRTRALAECRWPYTASSCKGAGRNSSGTSASRPAARSSLAGPAARIA